VQITNAFTIGLPPDRAYPLLLDLEQVTPCMPGAELGAEKDDGSRAVTVTVKLGPMRFVYEGSVRIADQDDAARQAVLVGNARETRGQGSAQATITMTVAEGDAGSRVTAVADVELTGRAATMGRGVVEDVAKKMIADMASCLEARFALPAATDGGHVSSTPAEAPPPSAAPAPHGVGEIRAGSLFWTVLKGRIKALFGRS
jgi:carbon monoxide dehydrogenase subunit G